MACINTLQSCSMFKGAKAEARRGRASGGGSFGCRASTFMDGSGLRLGLDENPDAIISGEWPENFSLLSYDDLRAYLQSQQQQQQQPPSHAGDQQRGPLLREAMSTPVLMVTAEQALVEVEGQFQLVSGLPVVDSARRCIGVVVKSDRVRASHGVSSAPPPSLFICFTRNSCRLSGPADDEEEKDRKRKHTPPTYTSCYLSITILC
uniref:CBS domain-containing protein n=1 Tax=Aegilops tauschii subsp. strangulata TaxID=200361 RepID=A0A453Q2L0_AEGTS